MKRVHLGALCCAVLIMSACAGETSSDTVACGEGTALTSDGLTCTVDAAYVESATEAAVIEGLANVAIVECGDGTTLRGINRLIPRAVIRRILC